MKREIGPTIAILACAVVLMLPAPPTLHYSFWVPVAWTDQFAEQLRAGMIYPRWLPDSHGGLGSPVFYYYPPLAYYLAGLFGLAGLTAYSAVIAAFATALVGSGFAMRHWLKGWARHPTFGALFYMAAPYHLYDFYVRGALAEFCATALLPLVALGVRRAIDGRVSLLAVAFAALIATHLPMALLVSVFLITPYALWSSRRSLRRLVPVGVGIALGIALAAVYLLPALALDHFRDTAKLWTLPVLNPEAWNLFKPSQWVPGSSVRAITFLCLSIGITAAALTILRRQFWQALALVVVLLAAGAVPILWSIPLMGAVQFPWRALAVAEFGIATAIALLPLGFAMRLALTLPMIALSVSFMQPRSSARDLATFLAHHPDVPEYLPRGAPPWTSWHSEWALQLADDNPGRVFYFPAWRVTCGGREVHTTPEPRTLLLAPARPDCTRRLTWTWPELVGGLVSMLAAAGLILIRARRRPRRGAAIDLPPENSRRSDTAVIPPDKLAM